MTVEMTFLWLTIKTVSWVILGFAVYAILLRQLARAVQPLRLRLAEEGEAALADGALSEDDEVDVRLFLGNAFNGAVAPFVMLMLPAAAFMLVFRRNEVFEGPPPSLAASRLFWLFSISAFAANPACGILVVLEAAIIMTIIVIATGSFAAARALVRRLLRSRVSVDSGRLAHRAH